MVWFITQSTAGSTNRLAILTDNLTGTGSF